MTETPIKVLLIEDNPGDARLIREMLVDVGGAFVQLECADRLRTGLERLAMGGIDALLLDLFLPDSQGIETFGKAYTQAPEVATIVLTGLDDEEQALRAVREGAQDYLVKGEVNGHLLVRSLQYAIERKRTEGERARLLAETERNLQRISTLYDIGLAMSSTLDVRPALEILLEKIDPFLPYSALELWLLNRQSKVLERIACRNLDEKEWKERKFEATPPLLKAIMESKAPVVLSDVQADPRLLDPEFFQRHGLVSYLGVPLITKDEILGVLAISTRQEHQFSSDEVKFFTTLAGQAAIAIHNSQLFEQVERKTQELSSLVKINRDVAMLLDRQTLLSRIAHEARSLLKMDSASFRLIEGEDLVLMSSVGSVLPPIPRLHIGEGISGKIINENRVLAISDILDEALVLHVRRDSLVKAGYHSFLGAPLQIAGQVIGIVTLYSKIQREFSPDEIELMINFADQAAISIENARLYEQVQRRTLELSSLVKINRDVAMLLDRQALLPRIAEEARNLLKMDSAHFRLIEGEYLVLKSSVGPRKASSTHLRISDSLAGKIVSERRVVAISNVTEKSSLPDNYRYRLGREGQRSVIGAPLQVVGRPIGIIMLYSNEAKEFSQNEIDLLTNFADQAAIALENARLYEETKRQAIQLQQDIAQRKLAESQLKQAHADLKKSHEELKATQLQLLQAAKLESVGRLAAGVAHEVKNPLEIILLSVEYLSKNLTSCDEQTATILDDIDYSVRRADSVIKGLLDFSASDEISTSIEELNPIIEGSLLLVKHELDRFHVAPVRELSENLPQVSLDRNKIKQAFVNFFINAIHAMPGGGTLTVRTYAKQLTETDHKAGHIQTDDFSIGETVVIAEVEDTGTGIPEDQLTKIFDPFFTTKPTGKGTGLGLTVTSKIIDLHGGMIDIRNRNEGGVRVSVLFKAHGRHQ